VLGDEGDPDLMREDLELDFGTVVEEGGPAGLGRLAENVVAIALWRRQLAGDIELAFWKNKEHEAVDFVIRERSRVSSLIQVCWDLSDPHTRAREFRALTKAGAELRRDELLFLTHGPVADEDFTWNGRTVHIRVVPIEQWLAHA
jgi:predicted AAA+ superfamily ATPase